MTKQRKWRVVLGVLVAFLVTTLGQAYWINHLKGELHQQEVVVRELQQVNDSTFRILTGHNEALQDSLGALKAAEDDMGGDLVAGARIVTKVDTVEVPSREVETTQTPDSGRYAVLTDTTERGIEVRIAANAPPYPSPLALGYSLVFPEFSPEVGFIETDEGLSAVVSWKDFDFTIENAWSRPPSQPRNRLNLLLGANMGLGMVSPLDPNAFQHADLYANLEYQIGNSWRFSTGPGLWNAEPYWSIGIEKVYGFSLPSWKDFLPF